MPQMRPHFLWVRKQDQMKRRRESARGDRSPPEGGKHTPPRRHLLAKILPFLCHQSNPPLTLVKREIECITQALLEEVASRLGEIIRPHGELAPDLSVHLSAQRAIGETVLRVEDGVPMFPHMEAQEPKFFDHPTQPPVASPAALNRGVVSFLLDVGPRRSQ